MVLLHVDGTPGMRQGMAGIGVVIRTLRGGMLYWRYARAPAHTSVEAEYQAVLFGLNLVHQRYPTAAVRCASDCEVVVRQLRGECAVRSPRLQPLYAQVLQVLAEMGTVEFVVVSRRWNRLADALAWKGLIGGRDVREASVGDRG